MFIDWDLLLFLIENVCIAGSSGKVIADLIVVVIFFLDFILIFFFLILLRLLLFIVFLFL
jgi:hypothetical protein